MFLAQHGYPYTTAEAAVFGGFILIRGSTVKYTIPWLNEPKATAGSRLRRAALPSRSQPPGPCDIGDPTPARRVRAPFAVRTAADRKPLSETFRRRSAATFPAEAPSSWAQRRRPGLRQRGTEGSGPQTTPARQLARSLTRTGFAQMLLQQRLLQQELEPASLRRGAGPAGGGRLPVRRLRAHPAPAAAAPAASGLQPDPRPVPLSSETARNL